MSESITGKLVQDMGKETVYASQDGAKWRKVFFIGLVPMCMGMGDYSVYVSYSVVFGAGGGVDKGMCKLSTFARWAHRKVTVEELKREKIA